MGRKLIKLTVSKKSYGEMILDVPEDFDEKILRHQDSKTLDLIDSCSDCIEDWEGEEIELFSWEEISKPSSMLPDPVSIEELI